MYTVCMNKKAALFIMFFVSCILILTGCDKKEQSDEIPSLQLEYQHNNENNTIIINHGTASWRYKEKGIESDAVHPLDSVASIPEIVTMEDSTEIKLKFSLSPSSYTIRSWTNEYIDNREAYDNYYEDVVVTNDSFVVPNDDEGYTFMVHAFWPQGNAYYGFRVVNRNYNETKPTPLEKLEDDETTQNIINTPVLIDDLLIGGLSKGVWLNYDDFYNSGVVEFEGFEYDVYSDNVKIATAIGSQPMNWMTGDILSGTEYEQDYCIVELYENDNRINNYDIAIKAGWDLYPRSSYTDNTKEDYYTEIVKDYLIEYGIENPDSTLKQSIRVDLDGDGTDEELIYADNKIEDTFDEIKKGDNAVVIFRRYVDGMPMDQVLDEHIIKEDPEYPSPYRLLFSVDSIADLDGDGIMEVIVESWYYEGFAWSIYKLIGDRLELVASNGIGA